MKMELADEEERKHVCARNETPAPSIDPNTLTSLVINTMNGFKDVHTHMNSLVSYLSEDHD
jgi:hypothetical protein